MNKFPKVMILVPSFGRVSPIYGAFLFAKYLKEKGAEVLFVSLDDDYSLKKEIVYEIESANIDYECLNIKGWLGFLYNRSRVNSYCNDNEIDVVISYLLRPNLINANLKGVIKIAALRGMLKDDYSVSYGKVISKIALSIEKKALKKMNHIFSLTNSMSDWLEFEGIDSNKISTVNNFLDVRTVRSQSKGDSYFRKNELNIGVFGLFIKRKRIDIAINAFAKLVHEYKHKNIRLHLAGDGPLRKEMERKVNELNINDKVFFHGFLKNPLQLMSEMHLILLTSVSEGMPRCLMEAMSLGKTVICSDIRGINELVIDKRTGYLFPTGDFRKLASITDTVIVNNAYINSDNLVDYMLERYDYGNNGRQMFRKIIAVYNNYNQSIKRAAYL